MPINNQNQKNKAQYRTRKTQNFTTKKQAAFHAQALQATGRTSRETS